MATTSKLILALAIILVAAPTAADNDAGAQREMLAAWDAFCDSLKAAGREIVTRSDAAEINVAEGFQYLAMLAGVGIERTQYYHVNRYPIVARALDGYRKLGLDSSDNTYRTVAFEPDGRYRIRGWRGNSTYLGFQINAGRAAVANLNDGQMVFNADGTFELYLGGEERGQNWVELPDGADNMYIREIFIDWETETPSQLWIERLDSLEPAAPLTIDTMRQRLAAAAAFVDENITLWDGYVSRSRDANMNRFATPRGTTTEGGSADNIYSGGYFSIAPDEALIIEVAAVESLFWNIQLGNRWFQSLDYQYRQTSLNSEQALRDNDDKYRFVIAHTDPGVANWLDTAGHRDGVMYFRWNQAQSPPVAPQVSVVPFADVDSILAAGTARVSAGERQAILRMRYQAVARRFGL